MPKRRVLKKSTAILRAVAVTAFCFPIRPAKRLSNSVEKFPPVSVEYFPLLVSGLTVFFCV